LRIVYLWKTIVKPNLNNNHQITPQLIIRSWGPCDGWPLERINAVFRAHGVCSATPLQVATCEDVPVEDRIWLLLHPDVLSLDNMVRFSRDCASRSQQQAAARAAQAAARVQQAVMRAEQAKEAGADQAVWVTRATAARAEREHQLHWLVETLKVENAKRRRNSRGGRNS
jgi:hypothetical protein